MLALKLVLSVLVVIHCSFGLVFANEVAQDRDLTEGSQFLANAFIWIYALTIFVALPVIWAWL